MGNLSKPLQIFLHGIWFLLFAMAVLLYKERLFADASYYFFHTINSGWFHVEHGRSVLALSQIVPLIGYYLHLPIKILLILGSVGHEVFYYTVFLLVFYKLKDQAGGIAILLIHVIGQLWLYYSPMLEICYGAALAILFYSILKSGKYTDDKWLILIILVQWLVMTSHLENFILIAVPIALDIINRGFQKRIHLITISFMVLGLVLEFLTMSEYELGKMNSSNYDPQVGLVNLLSGEYLLSLWTLFINYFPELVIMFLFAISYFIVKTEFKKLLVLLGSVLAIIMAVNKAALANEFTRYYESMYNPLVGLIVLFFVYEIYNKQTQKVKNILTVVLCLMAIFRIYWTWDYGKPLRERSAQMERNVDYLQSLGHTKYLVDKENYQRKYSHVAWSNPIETLLYSAIDGKENCLTIINYDDYTFNKNARKLNDSNYLFRRYEIENYDFLNPRFFHLKKEEYHTVNNPGFIKNYKDLAKNIKVKVLSHQVGLIGDTTYVRVRIENNNVEKLPSHLSEQIYLSYHWYQNNELVQWDGIRTPIEVDVFGQYEQDIAVAFPSEIGVYELMPDIVLEGKDWFYLSERSLVSVVPY